jgi:hypothetical protein
MAFGSLTKHYRPFHLKKFTRNIPVPGLIHLATPKIDDYDKFFKRPAETEIKDQHNLYLNLITSQNTVGTGKKSLFLPG